MNRTEGHYTIKRFDTKENLPKKGNANWVYLLEDGSTFIWDQSAKKYENLLIGEKTTEVLKTSQLLNDGEDGLAPFITQNDLPNNISSFTNDSNFITLTDVPSDIVTSLTISGSLLVYKDENGNNTPILLPSTGVNNINEGANITIDNTDPQNPIISSVTSMTDRGDGTYLFSDENGFFVVDTNVDLSDYVTSQQLTTAIDGVDVGVETLTGTAVDNTDPKNPVVNNSEVNFADEDGNVQYSSDTDKRTGYYDVTLKTYYPDILSLDVGANNYGGAGSGIMYMFNPKDSLYDRGSAGGGGNLYPYDNVMIFPNIPDGVFSFDIDLEHGSFSSGSWSNKIKLNVLVRNVSQGTIWDNVSVNYVSGDSDRDWALLFGEHLNGNIAISLRAQDVIQAFEPVRFQITNFRIVGGVSNNPLDFYNGWTTAFEYNNFGSFVEQNRVNINELKPISEIEIQDVNGVSQGTTSLLQMGDYLRYEEITSQVSIIDTSFKKITPYNESIQVFTERTELSLVNSKETSSNTFFSSIYADTLDTVLFGLKGTILITLNNGGVVSGSEYPSTVIYSLYIEGVNNNLTKTKLINIVIDDFDIISQVNYKLLFNIDIPILKSTVIYGGGARESVINFDKISYDSLGNIINKENVSHNLKDLSNTQQEIKDSTFKFILESSLGFADNNNLNSLNIGYSIIANLQKLHLENI